MVRELIIHSNTIGVEIALLEDKRLVEYHIDSFDKKEFSAGDIYLGKVKKINPGLNAAFIDIGHEKDAFIHYSDLSPNLLNLKQFTKQISHRSQSHLLDGYDTNDQIHKDGNIADVLAKGEWLVTQIMKEAISTKGPRMTCEVTIPGRYVVLAPFTNSVGISKRIKDKEERERLSSIIEKYRPKNFGFVVRTNAEGQPEANIQKDIESLLDKWGNVKNGIADPKSPRRVLSEIKKSISIVRDLVNDSFERIVCDNQKLFEELKVYLKKKAVNHYDKLELFQGERSIFDELDITRQIKGSFGRNVTLKSGAYLVLESTEALHVIDVNSGPKINRVDDQDTNAFNVNQEAGLEIARQMRLRDLGGIIVIDFIDMKSSEYRAKILKVMEEALKADRAKHSILAISKFGLMEITRQRVRSEISPMELKNQLQTLANIPSPESVKVEIEKEMSTLIKRYGKKYYLIVHPFVSAYLQKNFFLLQRLHWLLKLKVWIKIKEDSSLNLDEFYLINRGELKVDKAKA
ncbi:MAG: Rne/Rng family ribonuclease [Chitinophagales bacterium]|nr:Rne/Rng family ribonuclease [Chitinophagales bacterium]